MWKTLEILYPSFPTQAQRASKGGRDGSGPPDIFPTSKRTKSAVWAYFGYYKNAQGQLVEDGSPICRSCEKKVVATGGNTSNLRDHHPALFSEYKVK